MLDNLKNHFGKYFFKTCTKEKVERILERDFLFHPSKQSNWLNIVSIKTNMIYKEYWGKRIGSEKLYNIAWLHGYVRETRSACRQ